MTTIPKKIHMMWLGEGMNRDATPPARYMTAEYMLSWQSVMPTYALQCWSARDIDELIEQNQEKLGRWKHLYYHVLKYHIERCDVARLFVILIHGGWYFDLKNRCLKNLDGLAAGRTFVCVRDVGYLIDRCPLSPWRNDPKVSNSFFAATPDHHLTRQLLDYIMYNYKGNGTVFEDTGPVTWGKFMALTGNLEQNSLTKRWSATRNSEAVVNNAYLFPEPGDDPNLAYISTNWDSKFASQWQLKQLAKATPWLIQRYHLHLLALLILLLIVSYIGFAVCCTRRKS
jgi:mannosyltransferase OCH1-like enzyme